MNYSHLPSSQSFQRDMTRLDSVDRTGIFFKIELISFPRLMICLMFKVQYEDNSIILLIQFPEHSFPPFTSNSP